MNASSVQMALQQSERDYLHLMGQVRAAVSHMATKCTLTLEQPTFVLDGVEVGVRHVRCSGLSWLQIDFSLRYFEVTDADTLSLLLTLNQQLATTTPLVGYFAMEKDTHVIQFIQRASVSDLPVWALERYFKDTVDRLNGMFVFVVKV